MTKSYVEEIVAAYRQSNPDEERRLKVFYDFLNVNHDVFGRKNFAGHITTSAVVVDSARSNILLIAHKALGRYLQPGGHYERDATLTHSAAREVSEETGIKLELIQRLQLTDVPIDIDAHIIPASERKQEPSHFHFDFRYLMSIQHDVKMDLQVEEVTSIGWFALSSEEVKSCLGSLLLKKLHDFVSSVH